MAKWSKQLKWTMGNRRTHFYPREILRDFQEREKAIKREQKNLPEAIHDHVGMDTIHPTTNPGRYFVEFASSATIHGWNHLVAPHRHPIEKFLAILFILGALFCLIFLSLTFWDRYQNEATVIIIDNDRRSFKIRKPAFTIRPIENFRSGNVSSIFQKHGVEYSEEAENFFRFLTGVNYETMNETPGFDRVPPSKWLTLLYDLRIDIPTNLLKTRDMLVDGEWMISERGMVLAFRSYVRIYASFEYWMQNNYTVVPFPKEIPYYDYYTSLSDTEAISLDHRILVSYGDPFNMLDYDDPVLMVNTRTMHVEKFSLSEMISTDEVRQATVHQRGCKTPSDGGLVSWPIYTPGMCMIDCRMRVIQSKCGCRPHFVRPISGIPICNAQQLRCIGDIQDQLFLHSASHSDCDCPPSCDDVSYQNIESFISEMKDGTPTNLSIFRTNVEFPTIIYRHTMLFGFTAFLTSVGGAAGLFLGGSVLSFVEIFYYITVRLCVYTVSLRHKYAKKKVQRQKIEQLY